MEWLLKLIGPIIGKAISYAVLIYEAKNLSKEEKSIIRDYDGSPSFPMTNETATDELVKKSIVAMSTKNRAVFTEKGRKMKKIVEKYKFN
jgi:hypothetical protein